MKERPILFNGPMVRAILDGRKTQTRRVVKGIALDWLNEVRFTPEYVALPESYLSPYGFAGDRLWVRETWRGVVEISAPGAPLEHGVARYVPDEQYCRRIEYKATHPHDSEPYRPSIHMPRWASRITLEVTDVRVERLQSITAADAQREGIVEWHSGEQKSYMLGPGDGIGIFGKPGSWRPEATAEAGFQTLWSSINGAASWEANPWVWVVEFKRVSEAA